MRTTACKIVAPRLLQHHKAAQLNHQLEPIRTGHRIPANPFIAVLEPFGGPSPAEHCYQLPPALFLIAQVGPLPKNMARRSPRFQVVLGIQDRPQLTDFQFLGRGADDQIAPGFN